MAGSPDDPLWWRVPLASLGSGVGFLVAAAATGGTVGVVLACVGLVVALPAIFQGLFLLLGAAISTSDGADEAERRAARRVFLCARLVFAAMATGGVLLYVADPGVGSYQASLLLVLPLFFVLVRWAHRHLPTTVEWVLAIAPAAGGGVGYLVFGGAQWWNWGQFAMYPLVLLVVFRGVSSDGLGSRDPWYGGFRDGPWGPP